MRKLYLNFFATIGFSCRWQNGHRRLSSGAIPWTTILTETKLHQPMDYGWMDCSDGSSVLTFDVTNRGMGNGLNLTYTSSGIHISGSIWGGVDTGSSWSNPQLWTFDFTYSTISTVVGDDDAWAHNTDTSFNSVIFGLGTITQVSTGTVWDLRDQSMGDYSFRFGDEDDDLGHRGFPGISGWGWLDFRLHGSNDPWQHVGSDDFLFTAQIPEGTWYGAEPIIAALGLLGFAAFFRRRTVRA